MLCANMEDDDNIELSTDDMTAAARAERPKKNIINILYYHVQSQKAVSAYFTCKQILSFVFAEQYGIVI